MTPAQVVKLMRQGADRAAVAEAGAKALQSQSFKDMDDAVAAAGGILALAMALERHTASAGVCKQVSGALVSLALSSPQRKASIVAAGAIPLLAAAFRTHGGRAKAWAHEALKTLGYDDDGKAM